MRDDFLTVRCGRAPVWLKEAFLRYGVELTEVGICNALQTPVAHHIDMMALLFSDRIMLTPETENLKSYFQGKGIVITDKHLSTNYPGEVLLNAVVLSDYIICNTNTVAEEILAFAKEEGKTVIHVNQGYTKCAVCVVSDAAIITEDESIYESCKDKLDVLLIKKGEVELPGYEYGFIGGAAALIDDSVYFFGNIEAHPNYTAIHEFVRKHNKKTVSLSSTEKLLDIGGII